MERVQNCLISFKPHFYFVVIMYNPRKYHGDNFLSLSLLSLIVRDYIQYLQQVYEQVVNKLGSYCLSQEFIRRKLLKSLKQVVDKLDRNIHISSNKTLTAQGCTNIVILETLRLTFTTNG